MNALNSLTLDSKYEARSGRVFVSGAQALVCLPLMQKRRDRALSLDSAGYISGYRGSPLGGYDAALWRADKHLKSHDIVFQPGVNEDLAATACWGTQQVGLWDGAKHDGVFAIWYGKGPGVDRSGDPLKHGNLAGTAPHGGVLVLAGDDHGAKSSTTAHQSEQAFVAAMIPILYPATVQEFVDYGLHGFAMSRFSGAWVAMKCVSDVVEGSATISIDEPRTPTLPNDFTPPPGGVHIRWPDSPLEQEARLVSVKLPAAQAYVRANKLDRVTHASETRRLGIVAAGKAWLDTVHALDELGIDDETRGELGIWIYKVAMPWPLEPESARAFARGFDEILVVEEKRNLIEDQLARALYDLPAAERPRLIGKDVVPAHGELSAALIARIIANRYLRDQDARRDCLADALSRLDARSLRSNRAGPPERKPWFCAGCPHNSSTKVPEGSRALSGIGCHTMAIWMDRDTGPYTHMGGEGGAWIGQAPFTTTRHVFQNMGDGTYFHSGLLAVRAAVAAGVNVTFKILYNDAVALTGGQPLDGALTPWHITQQLWSEGVGRICVVSDEPDKYPSGTEWAPGVEIRHRSALDSIQKELREEPGVTAIIYDQTCAAEKRRRRKRGTLPDPDMRLFINDAVCEGCGDCNAKSNCVAVLPLETELGRKRVIDQSSCNKDFTCLDGFCPSFVSIRGAKLRKAEGVVDAGDDPARGVPEPVPPAVGATYNLLLTGIGGTGVVTAGALIATAAHIEGMSCSVLDQTGLSQKNGAVMSHVRLSSDPAAVLGGRIGTGLADIVLGFDVVVGASAEALTTMDADRTRAIINDHLVPLAAFAVDPDMPVAAGGYTDAIQARIGRDRTDFIDATRIATRLLGDAIAANVFLMGYAWQKGAIPLSRAALEQAIRLNGAAVDLNLRAFAWGRCAAADPRRVAELMQPQVQPASSEADIDAFIARRIKDLTDYQNAAYGERYRVRIDRLREAEARVAPGENALSWVAARTLFRLMAYKDEYEVARLFSDGVFAAKLDEQFEGDYEVRYHMAPPLLGSAKREFGPAMDRALRLLVRFKFLRGTPFDPFGLLADRRDERRMRDRYEALLDEVARDCTPASYAAALELTATYESIRGYGAIKRAAIAAALEKEAQARSRFTAAQFTPSLQARA